MLRLEKLNLDEIEKIVDHAIEHKEYVYNLTVEILETLKQFQGKLITKRILKPLNEKWEKDFYIYLRNTVGLLYLCFHPRTHDTPLNGRDLELLIWHDSYTDPVEKKINMPWIYQRCQGYTEESGRAEYLKSKKGARLKEIVDNYNKAIDLLNGLEDVARTWPIGSIINIEQSGLRTLQEMKREGII